MIGIPKREVKLVAKALAIGFVIGLSLGSYYKAYTQLPEIKFKLHPEMTNFKEKLKNGLENM